MDTCYFVMDCGVPLDCVWTTTVFQQIICPVIGRSDRWSLLDGVLERAVALAELAPGRDRWIG
jgi:hypothetical protein